uniref:UPF0400 protein C337.03-like n=1 Tax=Rhizophora mucronata TaxID=61149 RepID=A0A2P2KFH1_RHIMU
MLCCELLSFESFSANICPSKLSLLILKLNQFSHNHKIYLFKLHETTPCNNIVSPTKIFPLLHKL